MRRLRSTGKDAGLSHLSDLEWERISRNETGMVKTKVLRQFALLLALLAAGASLSMYWLYNSFYNRTIDLDEVSHLNVEEFPGTHPTRLKISGPLMNSSEFVRTTTEKRKGSTIVVSVHLALCGLGFDQPKNAWKVDYEMSVPDSVNEVQFGGRSAVIWRRGTPPTHSEN